MTPEKVAYALQLLGEPDRTITSIAKLLRVSRSTLYTALPELPAAQRGGQAALDERIAQLPPDSRPGPPTLEKYDALLRGTGSRLGGSSPVMCCSPPPVSDDEVKAAHHSRRQQRQSADDLSHLVRPGQVCGSSETTKD